MRAQLLSFMLTAVIIIGCSDETKEPKTEQTTETHLRNVKVTELKFNEDGKLMERKGKVEISIGGGEPRVNNKTTSNIVSELLTI